MAVLLEGGTKHWLGLSTDVKPDGVDADGVFQRADLPAGATFEEIDTGRIWRWDDERWLSPIPTNKETSELLREVVSELRLLREAQDALANALQQ